MCTSSSKYIENIAAVIVYLFSTFWLQSFDNLLKNDVNFH